MVKRKTMTREQFMAELEFLEGRKRLPQDKVFSLLKF